MQFLRFLDIFFQPSHHAFLFPPKSKHFVSLCSFSSLWYDEFLPPHQFFALLEVFSILPSTLLHKFEVCLPWTVVHCFHMGGSLVDCFGLLLQSFLNFLLVVVWRASDLLLFSNLLRSVVFNVFGLRHHNYGWDMFHGIFATTWSLWFLNYALLLFRFV